MVLWWPDIRQREPSYPSNPSYPAGCQTAHRANKTGGYRYSGYPPVFPAVNQIMNLKPAKQSVEKVADADGRGKARRIEITRVVTARAIGYSGIGGGDDFCLCGQGQMFLQEIIDAAA